MRKTFIAVSLMLALLLTSCASLSMTGADVGTFKDSVEIQEDESLLYVKSAYWLIMLDNLSSPVVERTEQGIVFNEYFVVTLRRNLMCDIEVASKITIEIQGDRVEMTISEPLRIEAVVGSSRSPTNLKQSEVEKINIQRQALFENFKALLYED